MTEVYEVGNTEEERFALARQLPLPVMVGPDAARAVTVFRHVATAAQIVVEEIESGHPDSANVLDALGIIDRSYGEGIGILVALITAGKIAALKGAH